MRDIEVIDSEFRLLGGTGAPARLGRGSRSKGGGLLDVRQWLFARLWRFWSRYAVSLNSRAIRGVGVQLL